MDSFARGYLERQRLTGPELEAIPFLFRLRAVTTLFLRLGRYAAGSTSLGAVLHRVGRTLDGDTWLRENRNTFLRCVESWQHGRA
jgi:Ser/Thr protein kinase RdoA (MazF antagonist)